MASMIEEQLEGHGFGLPQLAVMAASFEHLVHDDATGRLQSVFEAHDLPLTGDINERLVDAAGRQLDRNDTQETAGAAGSTHKEGSQLARDEGVDARHPSECLLSDAGSQKSFRRLGDGLRKRCSRCRGNWRATWSLAGSGVQESEEHPG